MDKEEKWKNAILTVLLCLIVFLTLTDVSLFTIVKVQASRMNELTRINQQQQVGIESFVMQIQQCETMDDLDRALRIVNVERIK